MVYCGIYTRILGHGLTYWDFPGLVVPPSQQWELWDLKDLMGLVMSWYFVFKPSPILHVCLNSHHTAFTLIFLTLHVHDVVFCSHEPETRDPLLGSNSPYPHVNIVCLYWCIFSEHWTLLCPKCVDMKLIQSHYWMVHCTTMIYLTDDVIDMICVIMLAFFSMMLFPFNSYPCYCPIS